MNRINLFALTIIILCIGLGGCGSSTETNEKASKINNVKNDDSIIEAEGNNSSLDTANDNKEELSEDPLCIIGYKVYEESNGYIGFDIMTQNVSDKILCEAGVHVNVLDNDGNIVDSTYAGSRLRVFPKQIIAFSGLVEKGKGVELSAEEYSFDDDIGGSVRDYFKDVKSFNLVERKSEYFIEPVEYAESAIKGDVQVQEGYDDIEITDLSVDSIENGFVHYSLKASNNTESAISDLGVEVAILDETGNIIGSSYAYTQSRIQAGQSIILQGLFESSKYEGGYITPDRYCYVDNDDEDHNNYLNTIPKAIAISDKVVESLSINNPDLKTMNQAEKVIRNGKIINNNEASEIFKTNFIMNSPDPLKSQLYEEGELGFYKVGETNYSCWIEYYNEKKKMNAEDDAPSTSITFYDFDYSAPNPDRMALFVQCFVQDKSYEEVVEFLKTKQAERPGGEFAKPSYFAYDNNLFLISGYLGYAVYRVSIFDSYINYDQMDPVLFLYLLYNYSDQKTLDEIKELSNEEAQKMVTYYKDHEADNLSNYNDLKRLSIEQPEESSSKNSKETIDTESSYPKYRHTCEECGKNATHSIELFGQLEWYCDDHYEQVMRTLDKMENDVGNSKSSVHTCQAPGCNKEGSRQITGVYGTTEYYCSEHYQQMLEIMESMTNGQ